MLADPTLFGDKNRSVPLLKEYNDLSKELKELLLKWEQRQGRLESTKEMLGL